MIVKKMARAMVRAAREYLRDESPLEPPRDGSMYEYLFGHLQYGRADGLEKRAWTSRARAKGVDETTLMRGFYDAL